MDHLLRLFVRYWEVSSPYSLVEAASEKEKKVLIVPICYGTRENNLCQATYVAFSHATTLAHSLFLDAYIGFACAAQLFKGSADIELKFKHTMLSDRKIPDERCFSCKGPLNTVSEAQMILRHVRDSSFAPEIIILVCGQMHSRGVLYVWKQVFPKSLIVLDKIPYDFETEREHPNLLQRTGWRFAFVNLARQVLLHLVPLRLLSGINQPVAY